MQTTASHPISPGPGLFLGISLATAAAVGFIVAFLPPLIALGLIAIAALIVAMLISPLAALIATLILSPLRTLIATEAPLPLPLDIGQILVLLLLIVWGISRVARGQRILHHRWTALYPPLIVLIAATGLTAFSAFSVGAWLNEWLKWLIIFALVLLCLELSRWQWMVFGVVLAGLANALVGLYIFLGGSGADHLLINERFFRAFGTFGQPNPFGGFMGLIAPLAIGAAGGCLLRLWQVWRKTRKLDRLLLCIFAFYSASGAVISLGVILSWSRGAWLGFVAAIGVVILAAPRKLWQSALLLVLITTFTATLWVSGRLPASITDRLASITEEVFTVTDVRGVDVTPANYAVVERLAHWQAALNMTRDHPWLGVGFGNYEIAYDHYRLLNWREPLGHAHNYYLNVLAETGIIGLIAYSAFYVAIIGIIWHTRRHPDILARFVAVGLLGTWTYLGVHSLTDKLYVNNIFLHLGVMLGIIAVLHRQICIHPGTPQTVMD